MNSRLTSWIAVGVFAATFRALTGDQAASLTTSFALIALCSVVVGVVGLVTRNDMAKLPLALVIAGFASFQAGNFIYQTLDAQGPVPFPGPADAAYLLLYPLAIAGLVALARTSSSKLDRRAAKTAAMVGAIGVTGLSVLIIDTVWRFESSWAERAVASAYPLFDGILLAVVVYSVLVGPRLETLVVAGAITSFVLGDVIYSHQLNNGVYAPGGAAEFFWLLAFAGVAAATLATNNPRLPSSDEAPVRDAAPANDDRVFASKA